MVCYATLMYQDDQEVGAMLDLSPEGVRRLRYKAKQRMARVPELRQLLQGRDRRRFAGTDRG